MSRYIDADKLCEGLVSNDPVVIAAKCEPTADVEPVRHGHWKRHGSNFECSNCKRIVFASASVRGETVKKWFKYCPECGAKMYE